MSTKRMNVLVYSGNGTTVESVKHCLFTLRRLLSPNYAVIPVTGDMILKEPWTASCAALVIPGGADLPYCRTLNGAGNRRIRQYVEQGGKYIGFCAGGYFAAKRCEFEVGNKQLEVVGDRELAFYPGIARGCAFKGFVYHSEKGARAAELAVNKDLLTSGAVPNVVKSYYNGGCAFVDAAKYADQGVYVLAEYTEELDIDAGEGKAAVVYCEIDKGAALLTGPHPEFTSSNLDPQADAPGFERVVSTLSSDEKYRMDFLKACLTKLGLRISEHQYVPSLSQIHLSSSTPSCIETVSASLTEIIVKDDDGEDLIKDENDTFQIIQPSAWKMRDVKRALPEQQDSSATTDDRIVDYSTIIKPILIHEQDVPPAKTTPYFNHAAFYAHLASYSAQNKLDDSAQFGKYILYGEVVTSTNTLLEKNTRLLRRLPHGLTFTATTQLAGRGRGSNVWVSPPGSLMFSTVIRHPMSSMTSAPVVFVQYLAAMAIVQGIQTYSGKTSTRIPIKLKWPNDIYALDPQKAAENGGDKFENYTKIGGILVNSHYNSKEYIAVCGIGLNVSNTAPSTSLNALLPSLSTSTHTQPFTLERLLASILSSFESLYTHFLTTGFDQSLESLYYASWLHTDQIVTVETENNVRAQIKGITRDYGLLIAEELGWQDRPTGRKITLMSDSNSFDFFNGLLKRKQ